MESKFKIGHKVYYKDNNLIRDGIVCRIDGSIYFIYVHDGYDESIVECNEDELYASISDLCDHYIALFQGIKNEQIA